MRAPLLTPLAALGLLASTVSGQSINIDFGTAAGVPADTYAGAGEPGRWNGLETVDSVPQGLVDLTGQPTNVTIVSQFQFDLGPTLRIDDPGTTGDDAALLDDFLPGFGDVVVGFQLAGLQPDEYEIVAYGWGPAQTPHPVGFIDGACVFISQHEDGRESAFGCMGGLWPGALEEGITHVTLRVATGTGSLFVGYAGNFFGASGFFNGIQIAPARCLCDQDGDNASDVFDLLAYLDLWFAGDADINRDGATDVFDLLDWLDCFFAGCA